MAEDTDGVEIRHSENRAPSRDVGKLFESGTASFEAGLYDEAIATLRLAAHFAPEHARIRSLLGLSIAYGERDLEQARILCESATKQEFFNPDLYLNMAQVYLVFGRRAEALRYLRRGQMIDPGHVGIGESIVRLGRRQRPMLPFLPRKHPINRALGGARQSIVARFFRGVAA
jgi:Flp pilus assembly protein TadD